MSQIGYMFLGAGLGAYVSGMFHLMTHAFFKALLFLAAGIVIHALAGEQDMRNMGGLRRYLPRTRVAFLVGALALAGIPPLSGFWSKDSILASALAEGWYGRTLLVAGLAGVFLTGLYTFRMFFLVFEGDVSPYAREHVHAPAHGEGPFSMVSTVAALAVLAAVGGLIQIPGAWHLLTDWLEPVAHPLVEPSVLQDYVISAISVALGLAGIWVAWAIYGTGRVHVPELPGLRRLFEQKFYFDEAYDWAFYKPAVFVARAWSRFVERPLIAGSIDVVAGGTRRAGGGVSQTQTGLVRSYALALAGGVAVLVLVFLSVRQ
jgi:NADH-quinone oxidoreductase subunit L